LNVRTFLVAIAFMVTAAACAGSITSTPVVAEATREIPATLDPDIEPAEYLPTLAPTSVVRASPTPVVTPTVEPTHPAGHTPSPQPTLSPAKWQQWPVIPVVSDSAKAIYTRGIAMGNDPKAFSKIGDCQNIPAFFLGIYENPDEEYRLGEYSYLRQTINYFKGSYNRDSVAVQGGFNVASVLSPIWADRKICDKDENPLACELREHRPSIAIISMETWWSGKPADEYEAYLRQIVEYTLNQGTLPILATKADNWEGDNSINAAIARVAADYDVPLWNFWLAVQPLPGHGVSEDGFHLTYARNFFDDPVRMQSSWPVRNLTALQVLDAVLKAVR
jgi:hypothetical protein